MKWFIPTTFNLFTDAPLLFTTPTSWPLLWKPPRLASVIALQQGLFWVLRFLHTTYVSSIATSRSHPSIIDQCWTLIDPPVRTSFPSRSYIHPIFLLESHGDRCYIFACSSPGVPITFLNVPAIRSALFEEGAKEIGTIGWVSLDYFLQPLQIMNTYVDSYAT